MQVNKRQENGKKRQIRSQVRIFLPLILDAFKKKCDFYFRSCPHQMIDTMLTPIQRDPHGSSRQMSSSTCDTPHTQYAQQKLHLCPTAWGRHDRLPGGTTLRDNI